MAHDPDHRVRSHKLLHITAHLIAQLKVIRGHRGNPGLLLHRGVQKHQRDAGLLNLPRIGQGSFAASGSQDDGVRLIRYGLQDHLVLQANLLLLRRAHDSQIGVVLLRRHLSALSDRGPEIRIVQRLLDQNDLRPFRESRPSLPQKQADRQGAQGQKACRQEPPLSFPSAHLPPPFRSAA